MEERKFKEAEVKRIITNGICILMVIWLSIHSVWAVTSTQTYAGNQLRTLGVLVGSGDGSLQLEDNITRAQVATIMVRILKERPVRNPEGKVFSDVPAKHWGKGYIQDAYKIGIIEGYPNGTFGPEKNITYAEVLAIMVNALGQKESLDPELTWPENYISKAKELGIVPVNSQENPSKIVTRGEMALIVWDTILVKSK